MTLPHFLVARAAAEGTCIELDASELRHARVRRVRRGEEVVVLDGRGWSAVAAVDSLTARSVRVRVVRAQPHRHGESPLDLTLAVALLKSDRFDWLIEKATELGVTRIRPFTSRFSLARPSPARRERWHQIALGAAKQCGRSVVPEVHSPVALEDVVGELSGTRLLFAEASARSALLEEQVAAGPVSVLIGPEGGFSSEERRQAEESGCRLVGLGPRILRAETAALTAVALCQSAFGDLGLRPRR